MKKQWKKKEKLNNEGFSLVEILACITILSIVTSAVFVFMMVGTRLFNRAQLEIDMQSEAQILKNYMNDLITDATIGVEFLDKSVTGEGNLTNNLFGADSCLTVYGEDNICYLAWVQDSKQVYFLKKEKEAFQIDENGEYLVTFSETERLASNWPVMANYVTGFSCDLENLEEAHRIFCTSLDFEMQGVEYSTTHLITLRNDIFYEGRKKGFGDEEMGEYEDGITRITLAPATIDKAIDRIKGNTVTYTHTVLAIGNVDKDVIYSVEGNRSGDTRMEGEVLFIAPDETASTLTVICRSKADANISTTAIVNLANVTAINVIPKQQPNYKKFYYYPKTVIDFNAVVEGDFITEEGTGVIWDLITTVPDAKIETSTQTGCRVNVGSELNTKIILKATSIVDPNVITEYTIHVADIEIGELYITAEDGMYLIKRGDTLQLQVLMNGQNLQPEMQCSWRIVNNPFKDWELNIDHTGKIIASTEIPYNQEYQFIVEASVINTLKGGETKTTTCAVLMDKVNITFEPGYAIVAANEGSNPSRVKMYVDGLKADAKEVSIQQRPYVKGLQYWTAKDADDTIVLALNLNSDKVKTQYTALRASLRGHSSVYMDLPVYFYKWNMIYNGKQTYVPVPGDSTNLIPDENKDEIPDTEKEVIHEGVTYGYKNITVNGVMYHFYVDKYGKVADLEWYLRVENDSTKYYYNKAQESYVRLSP